jgi:hypothetical protein
MTLILQYITLASRYLLALALNVITVIFTFVGCTHFMLVSNQSATYQRGVTMLDQEHAPRLRRGNTDQTGDNLLGWNWQPTHPALNWKQRKSSPNRAAIYTSTTPRNPGTSSASLIQRGRGTCC